MLRLTIGSTGEAEFTLRELVTARGNRLQLPLQDGALDASCTLIVLDSSDLNSDVRPFSSFYGILMYLTCSSSRYTYMLPDVRGPRGCLFPQIPSEAQTRLAILIGIVPLLEGLQPCQNQ